MNVKLFYIYAVIKCFEYCIRTDKYSPSAMNWCEHTFRFRNLPMRIHLPCWEPMLIRYDTEVFSYIIGLKLALPSTIIDVFELCIKYPEEIGNRERISFVDFFVGLLFDYILF